MSFAIVLLAASAAADPGDVPSLVYHAELASLSDIDVAQRPPVLLSYTGGKMRPPPPQPERDDSADGILFSANLALPGSGPIKRPLVAKGSQAPYQAV